MKILRRCLTNFTKQKPYDVVLIRHAESEFNEACNTYAAQMGIDRLGWEEQMTFRAFTEDVIYNQMHIDSRLTEKGKSQCMLAKQQMKHKEVNLILVSPKIRTLETCQLIFQQRPQIPRIVHPLLAEVSRYACDGVIETEVKKKQFPGFDFTYLDEVGDRHIHNISNEKRAFLHSHFKENKITDHKSQQEELMKLMKEKIIYETDEELRQRVWKIKLLLKDAHEKNGKVALVSHWYILTTMLSKSFNQDGTNLDYPEVDNCIPIFETMDSLLKIH